MNDSILGVPLQYHLIWNCPECRSQYKSFDMRDLKDRAHKHYQDMHGPLEGQGEFGFDLDRRMVGNPT